MTTTPPMQTSTQINDEFDPLKLVEDAIKSGFDPALASEIDERELNWCPNIFTWITDPNYQDVTTIYPTQLQVLLRLHGDVCPWCSDWDFYSKDFDVLESIGNIQDHIQLLNFGKCPKCGKTRLDQYNGGYWSFPNEMDLLWGMRCLSNQAWVFTNKGLVRFKEVNEGDLLSHGYATKRFDSGTLASLKLTTDFNWTLAGAKESHIVPILNSKLDLEHKLLKECSVGEYLVLCSPNLWPKERFKLPEFTREKLPHGQQAKDFVFPTEVTPELARLLGYLVSNGQYTKKYSLRFFSRDSATDVDIKRCCLSVFGEEPRIIDEKECETAEFCKCWSINGVAIMDWLDFIGMHPTTAHSKEIPECILQSPKDIVCEFLAGLFEGDGGLYVETVDTRKKVLLYYTSASKTLTEQVRLLLLNMGIVTNLSKFVSKGFRKENTYVKDINQKNDDNYSYRIATSCAKFIEIFKENVRLVSADKLEALTHLSKKGRVRYTTPLGDFQLGTQRCPDKITKLSKLGYFFVQIKDIQDGPDLPMMDVHIPETNVYTADGFVHHNSGKSAIAGLLASYHLHRFLKIPDPASYYNLLKGSLLVMRFVALTAGQANESIWHQFVRAVDTCAWFSQYHDFLKHHEKRLGVELNKWLMQSFGYTHKKITGYYLGASIDTSRGRTAIGSFFDEIGWWLGNDQAKRANAAETYQAYQKASLTIRNEAAEKFLKGHYDVPTALMAAVSSTSSKTDFIMHLIRLGKKEPKRICSHKASWEVNPKFAQNPDELAAERESNYKTYLRDYGSVPPYSSDPFFDNENLVTRLAVLPRPEWPVLVEKGTVGVYLSAQHVPKDSTIPYCVSVDLGYNKCGFAIALLKLKEADFSTIQLAGLWGIYPKKELNEVVDMSMCFTHFIKRLCEIFPIKLVVYDQWQSKTQIQDLLNMGIKAEQYSLTYKDFVDFRSQVIQAKLEVPEPELTLTDVDKASDDITDILNANPYLHFIWQMLSVSEIGNKVCKGEGHDDLFRAVVLGSSYLWDDDYRKAFEYKRGMYIGGFGSGKGRLAMAGGSMSSGQMFTSGSSMGGGGFNAKVVTAITNQRGTKPIGAIIPRGGK